jgi:metal transporter CNNM
MGDHDLTSSSDDESDSGHSGLSYAKRWAGRKKNISRRRIINGFRKDNDAEIEDGATITGDGDTLKDDRSPALSRIPTSGTGVEATGSEGIEMQMANLRQDWGNGDNEKDGKKRKKAKGDKSNDDGGHGDDVDLENGGGNGNGKKKTTFQLSTLSKQAVAGNLLEQSMPADAVLAKEGADEVCYYAWFGLWH